MTVPIDPVLPANFDNTPNDERTTAELDAWWDQPFAISRDDGTFDVRCLDGGAWDRSTCYGIAKDLVAAVVLAESKLAAWQKIRDVPVVALQESGCQVIRMSPRPGQDPIILKDCKTMQEAQSFIAELTKLAS